MKKKKVDLKKTKDLKMAFVNLEIENNQAWITINKEKSLNALNTVVIDELKEAIEKAEAESVRTIIITGAGGKAFVAGADIAEMKDFNSIQAAAFSESGHLTFKSLEQAKAVTIAMVDGFALGGGFELALSCDLVFATEKSKFGLPEVGLGLIPGFGGTQRLSRTLGLHMAKALTLSGDMVSADFLEKRGLVYKVSESREALLEEVRAYVKRVSQKGPQSVATAKRAIQKGYSLEFSDALKLEQQEFALLFGTKETEEGMSAFVEKRNPEFN